MSFKPEDLTEMSIHPHIDKYFSINTIDKDKQDEFLMGKLGSAVLIEHMRELTETILCDIGVWQSGSWDGWELAECTYHGVWFFYPSGNISHVVSNKHQSYDEQEWDNKRYVVQEDDANAKRFDSKTVGLIVSALAFSEASSYRGYNYDTRSMFDRYDCDLVQSLSDAHFSFCEDNNNASLDDDVKTNVDQMINAVLDTLSLYKKLH